MANDTFQLNDLQRHWARKGRQRVSASLLKQTLTQQKGLCAFSQAPLLFDLSERIPQSGGRGCHPLSPAVDHKDPGNPGGGIQIVCYALNDLKGHLPVECFDALQQTEAWKSLMLRWKEQAERDPQDRMILARLLRPNAQPKKKRPRAAKNL